ncbi:MAG TPA: TadE family protein [Methylococcus sp.]|nr:TadE family protein [Methylococcus sp.]
MGGSWTRSGNTPYRRRDNPARRRERGAQVVEFALVLPLFFALLFSLIEFSHAIWVYGSAAYGAREGTRFAMVHGSTSSTPATDADVRARVRTIAGLRSAAVTTTWPDGNNDPGSRVQVTVAVPFTFVVPLFRLPVLNLTATSRMVIVF